MEQEGNLPFHRGTNTPQGVWGAAQAPQPGPQSVEVRALPAQHHRTPGQTAADRFGHDQIAGLDLPPCPSH